jgi:hypothetical protein
MKFIRVVVRVGSEHSRKNAGSLDAPQQIIVDQGAMRNLRTHVGARKQLLRPLERGKDHVDCDVSVCVAINLNSRPVHSLDPGVEISLRLSDVALIRRLDSRVRLA